MQNEVSQKNRRNAKSLSKIRDDTKMTKTDNKEHTRQNKEKIAINLPRSGSTRTRLTRRKEKLKSRRL